MDPIADLHALVPATHRDDCERALRRGVHDGQLTIRPAPPGSYVMRDDRLYDEATLGRRGALRGALVGAVLAFAAMAVGLLDHPAWPVFVAGAAVLAGGVGAVIAMQMHEVLDDDPVTTFEVADDSWWLVTVHSGHWGSRAHRLLACHDARLVEHDAPLRASR